MLFAMVFPEPVRLLEYPRIHCRVGVVGLRRIDAKWTMILNSWDCDFAQFVLLRGAANRKKSY